jgi:hypothetical protein
VAAASSETTNMSQSMVTRDAVDKRTPSLPLSRRPPNKFHHAR